MRALVQPRHHSCSSCSSQYQSIPVITFICIDNDVEVDIDVDVDVDVDDVDDDDDDDAPTPKIIRSRK